MQILGIFLLAAIINPALNPVTVETAPKGAPIELVKDGKPQFVVLWDKSIEAKMTDRYLKPCRCITPAVDTLKRYFKEATGSEIVDDDVTNAAKYPDRVQFLVGESALTRELGLKGAEMPREGFTVTTFEKGVAIVGHDSVLIRDFFKEPRRLNKQGDRFGTLWGVYDFLERFLGCRFYYPGPDGYVVPEAKALTVEPMRYSDKPYIANRGGFYMRHWPEPRRTRTLGFKVTDEELVEFRHSIRWSEMVSGGATAHSPRPEAWIKENPELVKDFFFTDPSGHLWASTNSHAANFFDVTNLKNVEHYITTLKKFYASNGKNEQGFIGANNRYIPVGQCDTDVSLATLQANKTVQELGLITPENIALGRPGYFADIYGRFHYHLNRRLAEEFPEQTMTLIGYNSYSWPPLQKKYHPLTKPAYVALAFRDMPRFYRHQATREDCVKRLKAWREWNRGEPVQMIWCYNTGNTCFVHPVANNFLGEMIRGFGDELGSTCVFPEFQMVGNVLEGRYITQLFYFYAYYVGMRELWNPDYDIHAGYDELWRVMFGEEAGAHLKAMYTVLEKAFEEYALPNADQKALYPMEVLETIERELDAAERAVKGDRKRENRFKLIQLPLRHELRIQKVRHTVKPPVAALKRADAADWEASATVIPFIDPDGTGVVPVRKPVLKMGWTDEGLKGVLETDFKPLIGKDMWYGDTAEFFFSPGEDKEWTCQICVDPAGRITQRCRQLKPIPGADNTEWKAQGFTHSETLTEKGWRLEFFLPFAALSGCSTPKPGSRMSFASVYNASLGDNGHRDNWEMSATAVLLRNNHNPDNWGWLTF